MNKPLNPEARLLPLPPLLTVPALLVFMVVGILPLTLMLGSSLLQEGQFSLTHYQAVFGESRVFGLLGRSIAMAGGATLLALFLGIPFGLALARVRFFGHTLCKVLYLVPLFIPPHIHGMAWITLLGDKGILTLWLMEVFNLSSPPVNLYGPVGAAVILFLAHFPLLVLLILTGLESMDYRLEEAALCSKRPFAVLTKITLPLLMPYIISGAVFVFIFSFFNYGVPSMLRVQSFPVEIFTRFSGFFDEAGATALSLPMILVAFSLLIWQYRVMADRSHVTISHNARPANPSTSFPVRILAGVLAWGLFILSVGLPLLALAHQAGPWASYQAAFTTSWSEIITTLIGSGLAATCTVVLAYLLARYLESSVALPKSLLDLLSFLPFAFPAALFGIGLIHLWNRPATQVIYGSISILVLAYVARFIPFAIRILVAGFKQVNPSLLEAAWLCEPNLWQRLRRIELPLLAKPLATCWCITFIFCMGELGATLLVVPPGSGTVSLKIYTLMHYGAGPLVAALALILIATTLAVSTPLILIGRRIQT